MDMPRALSRAARRDWLAQGLVGHLFDAHGQESAIPHGEDEGARQAENGVGVHVSQSGKETEQDDPHIAPGGKKFTVGEVDQLDDTVYHGVAQRDQGVQTAQGNSVDQLLYEKFHRIAFSGIDVYSGHGTCGCPAITTGHPRHITCLFEQPLFRMPVGHELAVVDLEGDVGRSGVAVGPELDAFGHAVEIHLHDLGLDLWPDRWNRRS
jgi:hypothetical protein